MSDRTHDGRAFRILTLLDEYTRECLALVVERRLNSDDVLEALATLMIQRGTLSICALTKLHGSVPRRYEAG